MAFSKNEVIEFLDLFANSTTVLKEPMISWYGHGCYEMDKARSMVESGFIPKSLVISGYSDKTEQWECAHIFQGAKQPYVTTDDINPKGKGSKSMQEAINLAITIILLEV
jgi:hypothetical protein